MYLQGVGQLIAWTSAGQAGPDSLPKAMWCEKTTEQPPCGDVSSARQQPQGSLRRVGQGPPQDHSRQRFHGILQSEERKEKKSRVCGLIP